jgi:1-acyl-sn-glycerol-3-phosphate acyltransferase
MFERLTAQAITGFARILTGARAHWVGTRPDQRSRVYYANHNSHADFVLLWAVLPDAVRQQTRPVAAADYWNRGAVRRYLIHRVFKGVLVDRGGDPKAKDPLVPVIEALDAKQSVIIFPEGTRNMGEGMLPFKSGLYHLARQRRDVELVPVWIENLNRVMPKGHLLPVPLLCSVRFGGPVALRDGEEKDAFLTRARQAILDLQTT